MFCLVFQGMGNNTKLTLYGNIYFDENAEVNKSKIQVMTNYFKSNPKPKIQKSSLF